MHAEWFPGGSKTAPAVRSRRRAFEYKVAWHEAMNIQLDFHETTSTYESATPRHSAETCGCEEGVTYKTAKDGLIAKAKARIVAKGFGQVQDVHCFQTFAPTPSSSPLQIMAAVANEHGLKIFHLNIAQALFVRSLTSRYT